MDKNFHIQYNLIIKSLYFDRSHFYFLIINSILLLIFLGINFIYFIGLFLLATTLNPLVLLLVYWNEY